MLRPQPIGIFPFPANLLLTPDGTTAEELEALMRGESATELFRAVTSGDPIEIAPDDPVSIYNEFVLKGSAERLAAARQALNGPLRAILEITAYNLGYSDEVPALDDLDGELKSFGLMARATAAIERGEIEDGIGELQAAADAARPISPLFGAQITAIAAETRHQQFGADASVANDYRQAIEILKRSPLVAATANAQMNLGICYQEMSNGSRGALLEAVKCYQEALKFFARELYPEEFAFLQNNLALAYLSIPLTESSDQLRVAIAIQALREALKVYTKETHGELWASTQLNLANALQYAPTSHPEANLQEAVNLYEEILAVRRPTENPAGYARLLANQGNALAHLGIFDHAIPKLNEARGIFNQIGETDSAASIDEVLAEINERGASAHV